LSSFGPENLILTGANTRHHVASFAGPIAIKAVSYGDVEWRLEGQRYLIRPDTLLLLPDGDEYSMTINLAAAVLAKESPDQLSWLFEALGACAADAVAEGRRELCRLSALRQSTRIEILRRLNAAREAVEENLAAPWTLMAMAREATMAPHHFHHCFREAFREAPRGWLSRRRAERAMALLRTTSKSVTDICLAVGYASMGSFSSSFARRFGIAPSRVERRAAGNRGLLI
jgi:AraC-like DNA-binding protein